MTFRYRDDNQNLRAHIQTLRWVAAAECLLIGVLAFGWHAARQGIRVHIPPDLRSAQTVRANSPGPENVYAFAFYIHQQLYYWPANGQQDYGAAIFKLSYFFSPTFLEVLTQDQATRGKKGELADRVRSVQPLPGHGYEESRVQVVGNGVWVVTLDLRINEWVRGAAVKTVDIQYPVRVIQYDSNPEMNPWGLALDGYAGTGPQRLDSPASLTGAPK